MTDTLPKFDAPPVTETVLGVEFSPLALWGIPHFGLFWNKLRADYQDWSVRPPLVSQIEQFGDKPKQSQAITFQLVDEPEVRCWFFDQSRIRLIQVQKDRFIQNWRKVAPTDEYPHYRQLRQKFEREWILFREFIESERLGTLDVQQCEVTYFNHLELEEGWQSLTELAEILPCWAGASSGDFLPAPELIDIKTSYLIPENKGRLRISMQPAIRHTDAREILQLTITARGRPASSDTADILKWLDLGHEWAVRGFTDFTSAKMHSRWKRRQ